MLHPVSYCWYAHICFLFCFYFPLNPTVAPTAEVILISQKVMAYCCVYCGQLFLPGFLLLTEPTFSVPGVINCNKEDLTIMSSLTQYDYHQSSNVLLLFGSVIRLIRGYKRGIKSASTADSAEMSIIYRTPQKH